MEGLRPNPNVLPELTEGQMFAADALVEVCELEDVADTPVAWRDGQVASVRYGLGLCADRVAGWTPKEVRDMVLGMIEKQAAARQP